MFRKGFRQHLFLSEHRSNVDEQRQEQSGTGLQRGGSTLGLRLRVGVSSLVKFDFGRSSLSISYFGHRKLETIFLFYWSKYCWEFTDISKEERTTHKRVETAGVFILVLSGKLVIPNCFEESWAFLLYQKHCYQ